MIAGNDAYFFDLDDTLTPSKTPISGAHASILAVLASRVPVIIVSGASRSQIKKQIPLKGVAHLAQNGNDAHGPYGHRLWESLLTEDETEAIMAHIATLAAEAKIPLTPMYLQSRGCQISLSLIGHDAPIEEKRVFDADWQKRCELLAKAPLFDPTITVRIGGTTCLDYTSSKGTKGANVQRFIDTYGFVKPIYFGDALFPGGNDETVKGVCETIQVANHHETYRILRERLLADVLSGI